MRCWDRRDRMSVVLPAFAPVLNPVEQIWDHGMGRDPADLAPTDAADLRRNVRRLLIGQRHHPNLLASFFDHAGLPLEPCAPLSTHRSRGTPV